MGADDYQDTGGGQIGPLSVTSRPNQTEEPTAHHQRSSTNGERARLLSSSGGDPTAVAGASSGAAAAKIKVGVITDDLSIARSAVAESDGPLILCGGLRDEGGGRSPPLGLVAAVAPTPVYVVVRPVVDVYGEATEEEETVLLAEMKAWCIACPHVVGFVCFLAAAGGGLSGAAIQFARRCREVVGARELWLNRDVAFVAAGVGAVSGSATLGLLEREAGWNGALVPFSGEVLSDGLEEATRLITLCHSSGLSTMLLPVNRTAEEVCEAVAALTAQRTQPQAVCVVATAPRSLAGNVLPWKIAALSTNLFGCVPSQKYLDYPKLLAALRGLGPDA